MILKLDKVLACPKCQEKSFIARYESTYVYSYKIDTSKNNDKVKNNGTLPFEFDNREQKNSKQYIECESCGAQFPCSFKLEDEEIDFTIIRKAIRADHLKEPQFFG